MSKRLVVLLCLALAVPVALHAQALPTATRSLDLQAGGGFVSANADTIYDSGRFNGGFIYADADFRQHLGLELEIHQIVSPTADQVHERTYELGGRYFRTYGRFVPYGKVLYGRGVFNYPAGEANLAYNLYAAGAGLDYKVTHYLNARAGFEYQHWLSFPSGDISPTLLTIGVAYHFK